MDTDDGFVDGLRPDDDDDADPDGREREPLEPEAVSPEHAAFVLAGIALTAVVILNAL